MTQTRSSGPDVSSRLRTPRRYGQIQSYGEGRLCEASACSTTLSRYNKETLCFRHFQQFRSGRPPSD
jgi:hypothetical protein